MKYLIVSALLSFLSATPALAASETDRRPVQSFAERLKAQKSLRQEAKQEQIDDHENEVSEHHSKFQKRIIEVVAVK